MSVYRKKPSNWWKYISVYQIYPKSFYDENSDGIGDLIGVSTKIDYLKKLGIDAIWFSPIFLSPDKDNGYDIADYLRIDPKYGTMRDFDNLLAKANQAGIGIILDLVVNHSSSEHIWFKNALQGPYLRSDNGDLILDSDNKPKPNPYFDYYIWRKPSRDLPLNPTAEQICDARPFHFDAVFGGSIWEYVPQIGYYYMHNFAVEQPDLNWQNPKLRSEIYKMMNFWLDKGIAGFRMDVIDCIGKDTDSKQIWSGPYLHQFIQEMNSQTFGKYNVLTVGETPGVTEENAKDWTDPKRGEVSMVFHFQHVQKSGDDPADTNGGKWSLSRSDVNIPHLKQVLSKWQNAIGDSVWNGVYWENHDQPRVVSRFGNDHEYRELSAKAFAYLQMFMKGTPFIFQGQEIGLPNTIFNSKDELDDIEEKNYYKTAQEQGLSETQILEKINYIGRDTSRTPLPWSGDATGGFSNISNDKVITPWLKISDKYRELNIAKTLENVDSVFYHYQFLLNFRKKHSFIADGNYELINTSDDIYAFLRWPKDDNGRKNSETILVVANLSNQNNEFSSNLKVSENGVIIANCENYLVNKTLAKNLSISVNQTIGKINLLPWQALALWVKD